MRTTNNANTSRSNLKDSALSVPVFCALFFEKRAIKSKSTEKEWFLGYREIKTNNC